MLKQVGLEAVGSRGHFDPLSPDVLSQRLKDPLFPQTHLEAFRTKSGPLDLEVSGSCLDPGLLLVLPTPAFSTCSEVIEAWCEFSDNKNHQRAWS